MHVMNAGSKPYKRRCICCTKLIKDTGGDLSLSKNVETRVECAPAIFSKTLAGNPLPPSSFAILHLHEVPSFERSKSFSIL